MIKVELIDLLLQKFKAALRPSDEWGPMNRKIKREWIAYNQTHVPFTWVPKTLVPKIFRRKKTTLVAGKFIRGKKKISKLIGIVIARAVIDETHPAAYENEVSSSADSDDMKK